ncbi:MAG: DUF6316 family protein [Gammaproteobacteria bacterium]|nr:DUF6316 family protein [Gammaproteobacteria bacterium]
MRKDDSQVKAFSRAESRVFELHGSWWFATRDTDSGPYASEEEASAQLTEYVQLLRGDIDLDEIGEIDNVRNDETV